MWNCLLILFYKRPAGASAITQITAMLAVSACSTREDPPGNPWVSAISVMKNTGTVPLYIDGISFDLEDASGSLMEEIEYSAKGATLQPQSFSFRGIPIGEDRSAGDSHETLPDGLASGTQASFEIASSMTLANRRRTFFPRRTAPNPPECSAWAQEMGQSSFEAARASAYFSEFSRQSGCRR